MNDEQQIEPVATPEAPTEAPGGGFGGSIGIPGHAHIVVQIDEETK